MDYLDLGTVIKGIKNVGDWFKDVNILSVAFTCTLFSFWLPPIIENLLLLLKKRHKANWPSVKMLRPPLLFLL